MIDDKIPRRINPKGIGLICIYIYIPRPSSYPLLGLKHPLLGTMYPQLRVQGGSWYICMEIMILILGTPEGTPNHGEAPHRV